MRRNAETMTRLHGLQTHATRNRALALAALIVVALSTGAAMAGEISFEKLPFVQAIDALQRRVGLGREAIDRLQAQVSRAAKSRAFLAEARLLIDVWDAVSKTLESGGTVRDFLQSAPAVEAGWTGEDPYRGVLVYQQQTCMAYQAGQLQQFDEAGIEQWKFAAFEDEATCPICGRLDGRIFDKGDLRFYPPVHFNCRCYSEPVFAGARAAVPVVTSDQVVSQIARMRGAAGLEVQKVWDTTLNGPGAFRWNPREFLSPGDVALPRVPEGLRPALQRLAVRYGVRVNLN
jgi:SPP1 gp7 family putative phage head morphogenesis protein